MTAPVSAGLEAGISRLEGIEARKSHFRPRDMLLSRFERERDTAIGRPGEGSTEGTAPGAVRAFAVVYPRAALGIGMDPGVTMALNEGQAGVPIGLDPAVLAAAGHVVADPEHPPGAKL